MLSSAYIRFVLLIVIIGVSGVLAQQKPDIDHDEIYKMVNNSCVSFGRRRRSVTDIMGEVKYRSAFVLQNYKKEFAYACKIALDHSGDVNLPEYTEVTLEKDIKAYYAWMLWVKMAEEYLMEQDLMMNRSFNKPDLDSLVNYIRQAVCYANNDNETKTTLPKEGNSTDPLDYRVPACAALRKLNEFSIAAVSVAVQIPIAPRRRRNAKGRRGQLGLPA